MNPAAWNLLHHPATGWRAWWMGHRHARRRSGPQRRWGRLGLGAVVLGLGVAWGLGAWVQGVWTPAPVAASVASPAPPAPPAWRQAWLEAWRTQPRVLALEAALPPWDTQAPERSRLW